MAAANPILPGEKFGKLTVIEFSKEHKQYRCSCACGGETLARSWALRSGRHQSCSCGNRIPRPKQQLPNNLGPKKELYRKYEAQAKRRGIAFELTVKLFSNLIERDCHYCGVEPNTKRVMYKRKSVERTFVYNGVDRVDNKNGYTVENCVTCCSICNNSKATLTIDEWKTWLKRVATNLLGS